MLSLNENGERRKNWPMQKTTKNRARRQKKKERSKGKASAGEGGSESRATGTEAPLKKRRLVNGKELVFRQPGVDSDEEEGRPDEQPSPSDTQGTSNGKEADLTPQIVETTKITFHEDD